MIQSVCVTAVGSGFVARHEFRRGGRENLGQHDQRKREPHVLRSADQAAVQPGVFERAVGAALAAVKVGDLVTPRFRRLPRRSP
jgi:hypothetical protein